MGIRSAPTLTGNMITAPVLLDIPLAAGTRAARPLDQLAARDVGGLVSFSALSAHGSRLDDVLNKAEHLDKAHRNRNRGNEAQGWEQNEHTNPPRLILRTRLAAVPPHAVPDAVTLAACDAAEACVRCRVVDLA